MVAFAQCGWSNTVAVTGGDAELDSLGEAWANERGIPVKRFRTECERHGAAAEVLRNRQMAEYAEALVALWNGKNCRAGALVKEATERGKRVYIYNLS